MLETSIPESVTMMRFIVFALAFVFVCDASGQDLSRADIDAGIALLDAETHCYVSPAPVVTETRAVCVWRPNVSPDSPPLPVLYVFDGMAGLHIVLLQLRPAILSGAIPPMMVVATDPKAAPEDRAAEYLRGWSGGSHDFELHEKWLLDRVIPWAERTQRASRDRGSRFIGGFSNGGDLALALASDHPDVFAGALIHSPVGSNAAWVKEQAGGQRWVITGGTQETRGSVTQGGTLPRRIAQALQRQSAPVRVCIGRWTHHGRYWRQLSPGSIAWLMGAPGADAVQSPLERANCQVP